MNADEGFVCCICAGWIIKAEEHKYGMEDDWIDTPSDHQMDAAVIYNLECDTEDALKEKLKNNETK